MADLSAKQGKHILKELGSQLWSFTLKTYGLLCVAMEK